MKNLVIGLVIGSFVSCAAQATLTRNYTAQTPEDIQKCIEEVTANADKGQVSFKLFEDGSINYDSAVCWPDGIAISDK